GSLGATALPGLQPAAKAVSFDSLDAAFVALQRGKVDGLLGDSIAQAGLSGLSGMINGGPADSPAPAAAPELRGPAMVSAPAPAASETVALSYSAN
ncbi:MAG: hypothetical protein ACK463_34215, partial [Bradyrhizobium sp.]